MANTLKPAGKEDLRQRRTRALLTRALLSLLEEQPFQSISVVDICDRAMVHRTTFYAHFPDKQALLNYTLQTLYREFSTKDTPPAAVGNAKEYFLAVFRNLLAFMREHPKLYRTNVTGSSGMELILLEQSVAEQLCGTLSKLGFLPNAPGLIPEVAAHFYAGAVLALTRWWLEQETPPPEDVLLRHLECFIPLP